MITFDQLMQVALVIGTFAGIMLPLHQANKKRSDAIARQLNKMRRKLKSHDERARQLARQVKDLATQSPRNGKT